MLFFKKVEFALICPRNGGGGGCPTPPTLPPSPSFPTPLLHYSAMIVPLPSLTSRLCLKILVIFGILMRIILETKFYMYINMYHLTKFHSCYSYLDQSLPFTVTEAWYI